MARLQIDRRDIFMGELEVASKDAVPLAHTAIKGNMYIAETNFRPSS